MIKKFFTFIVLMTMVLNTTVSAAIILKPVPTNPTVSIETPVLKKAEEVTPNFNINDLMAMSAKDFEKATGKKLNFFQKMKFKLAKKIMKKGGEGKSQVIALILCLLVGAIGIHRFYLGYTWQGVVQLLTLGGLGIWTLIDLIRIIIGDLKPKDGEYAKTL